MTTLAKRIATALIFCVGAGGTLGCELISTIDRSKIPDGIGAGGAGGEPATTTTSSSTSSGTSTSTGTGGAGGGGGGQGGSGGSADVCGDGAVSNGEGCDDGNTISGDGCDPLCTTESGFDCVGAPSVCKSTCGDGVKAGAELCDDNNLVDLDGCSSLCQPDTFSETEPNGTAATANGPFTPSPGLVVHGSLQPGADVDVFAIVLPATVDLRVETFDASGPSSCNNIDTELILLGTDGATVIAADDDGGVDACSKLEAKGHPAVAHLPAGTYYVEIGAYDGFKPVPGYTLVVTFDALCGDGKKQGREECDGGATCSATCDRLQVCGDGFVDAPEACDDGNTAANDGCSAACQYEILGETEPNGSAPTANGAYPPNVLLGGAINPAADVDYFEINLATTADLAIATFDATGPSSCAGIDTVVTLVGTDGTTALIQRDQGGVNACGAIDSAKPADGGARHLPPGAYFIKVEDYQNNTIIPGYTVRVTFNAVCGDGVVEGAEECDGGAGCSATCDRVQVCGDGLVDAPESCDDGNAISGDGCSATCLLETTPETEPNDTAATASGPFSPHALINGAITPGADVDYFAVTLTATADLQVETFDGNGPGSCVGLDSVVTLFAPDGTTVLTTADDGGLGTCSRIDPALDPAARHLAPGTYLVMVEDFGNDTVIPAYTLELTITALCGNGKVEGGEECDGDAGCTATCDRIAACGDGFLDAPETCDDGNTVAGDGCGATCVLETTAELEPNDDLAGADAAAVAATPVKITGTTVISGAITVFDEDYFTMSLAQPTVVRLETFDGTGADCTIQTTLRIWSGAGIQLHADDNSGIFTCSALVVPLPAGSYYVSVEERTGGGTIPAYVLQASFEASAGPEIEPNDAQPTATALAGSDVYALGDHAVNTDSDCFAITVPAGKSLRAEVIEGDAETCESSDVDSFLTLFDANGVALGGDDDAGRGFCSLIDGTGAAPADPYAHGLAAGTYYLLVEAAPTAQAPTDTSGQFAYRLAITLR